MSEEHLTASELLERTGMKSPSNRQSVTPAELEAWLETQSLATVREGKVIPTPKAQGLVDALRVDWRGDGVRRATRLG